MTFFGRGLVVVRLFSVTDFGWRSRFSMNKKTEESYHCTCVRQTRNWIGGCIVVLWCNNFRQMHLLRRLHLYINNVSLKPWCWWIGASVEVSKIKDFWNCNFLGTWWNTRNDFSIIFNGKTEQSLVCLGRLCDLKKINGKNYTTMQTLDGESNATKKFIEKILNYHHRCSFLTLSFLHYLWCNCIEILAVPSHVTIKTLCWFLWHV